ncbi:MAG: ribonuclease HI family protein [Halobacteriota archaeon]
MKVLAVDVEEARRRLERVDADVEDVDGGWRARFGGATVEAAGESEVEVRGNVERVENLLGDGGRARVYFDGASRGNPGTSAVAYVVEDDVGALVAKGRVIGRATNNEAEYTALLAGLAEARALGFDRVTAIGDSELVVRQVAGDWRCRADNLKPLLEEVHAVVDDFEEFEIKHVPREVNERADGLANEALDA